MFTLAFCFIFSKLFLTRRLRKHEKIFQTAREAAFRGENYEEVKRELELQYNMHSTWRKNRYREYGAYRKYFMNTMKSEYSEEELMFFRFDEYYTLCVNDLIGKISGGTWLAWIFFAFNFYAVVYIQGAMSIVARALLFGVVTIATMANNSARSAIFKRLKEENEDVQSQDSQRELTEIGSPQRLAPVKLYSTPIIILNQSVIWLGLTNVFTSFFAKSSLTGVVFWSLLITLGFVFIIYGFSIFQTLPTIGGALYNGAYINKQFVKEVMKRHPQVDKQILIDQYRDKNNGELPVIFDAYVEFKDNVVNNLI